MGDTEISWTHRPGTRGRTWNPTQGCSLVSEGCRNCYAMRMAARFAKDGWSQGLINLRTGKWNGTVRVAEHKLVDPLRWREPSTVFVNSMSDLFHDGFSNEEIAAVFGVMAACPQHTFQILTKRPERLRAWFEWVEYEAAKAGPGAEVMLCVNCLDEHDALGARIVLAPPWPLPNVWIGASVENQDAANERIPHLLATPAAIRFLSCEPLLGPVDITHWIAVHKRWQSKDTLPDGRPPPYPLVEYAMQALVHVSWRRPLHWVIAGCESGPRARACEVDWLRSLRDQCAAAGVPYFLKQAVVPAEICDEGCRQRVRYTVTDPKNADASCGCTVEGPEACSPVGVMPGEGSKRKGHGFGGPVYEAPYLDGVQHLAFPVAPTNGAAHG